MELVFIDEQYGQDERGKYTAILAAIFNENVINQYRLEFVSEFIKILELSSSEEYRKTAHWDLPVLHGSNMLPDYSDDKRIAIFKLVSRLVVKYNIRIIRTGYYDKTLVHYKFKHKSDFVGFCISKLDRSLVKFFNENYIYIYELDKENLNKTRYNDISDINVFGQFPEIESSLSIDLVKCLGRFYCSKQNHCMYASDIMGYLLKKRDESPHAPFVKQITSTLNSVGRYVLINEIIFMNFPK